MCCQNTIIIKNMKTYSLKELVEKISADQANFYAPDARLVWYQLDKLISC